MAEKRKGTFGKMARLGAVLLIFGIASYFNVGDIDSAGKNGEMKSNFASEMSKQTETVAKKRGATAREAERGGGNCTEEVRAIPRGAAHGVGRVIRILRDDEEGIRHQKFILRLTDGGTLLIAHNIDLASRIEEISVGDEVEYCGEFADNEQGGLVHWTHLDPDRRHAAGWLKHKGKIYE